LNLYPVANYGIHKYQYLEWSFWNLYTNLASIFTPPIQLTCLPPDDHVKSYMINYCCFLTQLLKFLTQLTCLPPDDLMKSYMIIYCCFLTQLLKLLTKFCSFVNDYFQLKNGRARGERWEWIFLIFVFPSCSQSIPICFPSSQCFPKGISNSTSSYPIPFVQSSPLLTLYKVSKREGTPSSHRNCYFGELAKF